ncbi:uncharacterized protein CLUP02_00822 [Colletotrichum lupini]|uniref:Uncharacterized protein n=1 Tax=Colletotrichum lupini TaxID=145971 RepID=A0A9Q8SBI2_9PEZI|nr:uncharacterized protein CLUP02_00822 [Colletotrichum lupini]UQC74174.1 hypothetical protein CLUP02_00822 [Colletotrichum lupini]
MSGNTLYGSGSHGRCSHGDVPGKFGGLPLKVARVAVILQLAIGPHPSPPRTRSMFYECPWAHVPIQTRRQGDYNYLPSLMPKGGTTRGKGACADAGRRFGDEGLGSGHFSETEEG